jgi:hypothetical protein
MEEIGYKIIQIRERLGFGNEELTIDHFQNPETIPELTEISQDKNWASVLTFLEENRPDMPAWDNIKFGAGHVETDVKKIQDEITKRLKGYQQMETILAEHFTEIPADKICAFAYSEEQISYITGYAEWLEIWLPMHQENQRKAHCRGFLENVCAYLIAIGILGLIAYLKK